MTREELLDFAQFAMKAVEKLQCIEDETQDFRLRKEMHALLGKSPLSA